MVSILELIQNILSFSKDIIDVFVGKVSSFAFNHGVDPMEMENYRGNHRNVSETM